jgi:hypothetical protein
MVDAAVIFWQQEEFRNNFLHQELVWKRESKRTKELQRHWTDFTPLNSLIRLSPFQPSLTMNHFLRAVRIVD